jgi:hypothetical protein
VVLIRNMIEISWLMVPSRLVDWFTLLYGSSVRFGHGSVDDARPHQTVFHGELRTNTPPEKQTPKPGHVLFRVTR